MAFQSRDGSSVKSLLDILRTAQDSPSTHAIPGSSNLSSSSSLQHGRTLSRTPSDKTLGAFTSGQRRPSASMTAHARQASSAGSGSASQIPSAGQLNDLLRSLGSTANTTPPAAVQRSSSGHNAEAGPSRVKAKERTLIEPFGPIGALQRPSIAPTRSSGDGSEEGIARGISGSEANSRNGSYEQNERATASTPASTSVGAQIRENGHTARRLSSTGNSATTAKGKMPIRTAGWDTMPLGKALPVITDLLEQPEFIGELKKIKADQDALERRMWAKSEKIKAEHERIIQAERDIARLARRPISPAKQAQWQTTLHLAQTDFLRQTCLPSTDALAKRHRDRLRELGVPGLGRGTSEQGGQADGSEDEDEEVVKVRVRKIMDVIQAVLDD